MGIQSPTEHVTQNAPLKVSRPQRSVVAQRAPLWRVQPSRRNPNPKIPKNWNDNQHQRWSKSEKHTAVHKPVGRRSSVHFWSHSDHILITLWCESVNTLFVFLALLWQDLCVAIDPEEKLTLEQLTCHGCALQYLKCPCSFELNLWQLCSIHKKLLLPSLMYQSRKSCFEHCKASPFPSLAISANGRCGSRWSSVRGSTLQLFDKSMKYCCCHGDRTASSGFKTQSVFEKQETIHQRSIQTYILLALLRQEFSHLVAPQTVLELFLIREALQAGTTLTLNRLWMVSPGTPTGGSFHLYTF